LPDTRMGPCERQAAGGCRIRPRGSRGRGSVEHAAGGALRRSRWTMPRSLERIATGAFQTRGRGGHGNHLDCWGGRRHGHRERDGLALVADFLAGLLRFVLVGRQLLRLVDLLATLGRSRGYRGAAAAVAAAATLETATKASQDALV